MVLTYVTKFPSVLIFADEVKIFYVGLFSRVSQKLYFASTNFRGKSKNAQNRKTFYTGKFSAVMYVS